LIVASMPLFSVVVIHYQGSISRETYLRGIDCVLGQTFKDVEVIVMHDGALLDAEAPTPVAITCTERRFNDWGHSLRDIGIKRASGDYVLIFNADNVLYPQALEKIAAEIARPSRLFDGKGRALDTDSIIIFPILKHDTDRHFHWMQRFPAGSGHKMIMTGNPPALGYVDVMQFVMKRSLWMAEGGWYDKSEMSDGNMYPVFARKYGYRGMGEILGEHF
jgi:hypothetical protein